MTTFVVPAAGLGSRFSTLFPGVIKPLIPIDGIHMLDLVVDNLEPSAGDLVVVVGREGTGLGSWVPTCKNWRSFNYIYREVRELTRGPAETVLHCLPDVPSEGAVVVANSDQLLLGGMSEFLKKLNGYPRRSQIVTMRASGSRWSFVRTEGVRVLEVAEKKEISDIATVGIYGWPSKHELEFALAGGMHPEFMVAGEFYVAPTYNVLISEGFEVHSHMVGDLNDTFLGLGTPEDLESSRSSGRLTQCVQEFKARQFV